MISDPEQAETVLGEGAADAVLLAREALRDSSWPLRAMARLDPDRLAGAYPWQYGRAVPAAREPATVS